jgi:hypothetical protein
VSTAIRLESERAAKPRRIRRPRPVAHPVDAAYESTMRALDAADRQRGQLHLLSPGIPSEHPSGWADDDGEGTIITEVSVHSDPRCIGFRKHENGHLDAVTRGDRPIKCTLEWSGGTRDNDAALSLVLNLSANGQHEDARLEFRNEIELRRVHQAIGRAIAAADRRGLLVPSSETRDLELARFDDLDEADPA